VDTESACTSLEIEFLGVRRIPQIYSSSNLETEVLGAHSNTANITEYIPVGNALSPVKLFKCKDG